jgi:hypothetical protein
MKRANHVTVFQHTVTNDAATAHSPTAMVANVVGKNVVARVSNCSTDDSALMEAATPAGITRGWEVLGDG